jgi:hypothetical protein
MAEKGRLKVQAFVGDSFIPLDNATVRIRPSFGDGTQRQDIVVSTDVMGETEEIELDAPPLAYSEEPTGQTPYSMYDVRIDREGFESIIVNRCQIFPGQTAIQPANMIEVSPLIDINRNRFFDRAEVINVGPNTLNGNYPPKIPEDDEKPLPEPTSGVVLPEPVIPEFIVVHAGGPNNPNAPNYRVRYKDYIKNVASCEIYSTWPDNTIRANVYAIISFTLNRIYTEWYRGKGKNFQITNSTAYDHAFIYGRNYFDSITRVVDDIFATYIRRFNSKQPLLAQYCDGQNVQCPGWMTQWGSKYLGAQGRTPYEILTNFYGSDIELVTASEVEGIPESYPGFNLTIGSSGPPVRTIQEQLNRIADNYPLIPKVAADGVFGEGTAEAVRVFQQVFNLPQTGVVDYATWYEISNIYVGVTRIAELRGDKKTTERIFIPPRSFDNLYDPNVPRFRYKDDR